MASDPPKHPHAEASSETAEPVEVVAAVVKIQTKVEAAATEALADAPPHAPAEPVSPAKEWAAALVLMIVFGFICAAFISMLRG